MNDAVLVTGASRGIGREIATVYAERGEDLVVVARSTDELETLKEELETDHSVEVKVISKDLSDPSSADELFERLENLDVHVKILVNNAGFGTYGPFTESDVSREQDLLELNMVTLTRLCRLFLDSMQERGRGKIMNVASTGSFTPGPYMTTYYASKAYVLSFTEGLAEELSESPVEVSALCPGPTITSFQEEAGLDEAGLLESLPGFLIADARSVAEYGIDALERGTVVAVHGWTNWLMVLMLKLVPRIVPRKLMGSIQGSAFRN